MRAKSIRRLDGQGRVILPSHIRKALQLRKDSAVTIDMTEDGRIIITPAEKRCCICGEGITGQPHLTVESWIGPKYICESCDEEIHKNAEWEE